MTREEATLIFSDCQRAYQLAFNTPAGQAVLADLSRYCRAKETCVSVPAKNAPVDIYRTLILEGRRDVLLNIQSYLELTVDQLVDRYTIELKPPEKRDENLFEV